jgi:signal transduction histidine kinase
LDTWQKNIESRAWMNFYQSLLVGALLALAVGIIFSRWLVAPLNHVEAGAKALSERQLGHRVPEKGSAEMRSVARSFNQMADQLEQQETLRNNLLADVAHELRHPVHILQGNLLAILDGIYPLERKEIARLLDQTDQLTNLVEDLHQLALAEAQQLPLHKQELDLGKILELTINNSRSMFSSKAIVIETNIPDSPIICKIDDIRIRQALQNIINNAFDHTPKNGLIEVTLWEDEESVKISVRDTGTGVLPEHLPHVFDRFYKVDSSRDRESSGTGLGLAIAQAIIQAHGGEITAFSSGAGQGSTFTIILPESKLITKIDFS